MAPAMVITPTSTAIARVVPPTDMTSASAASASTVSAVKILGESTGALTVTSFHENLVTKVAPIGRRRNSLCARVDERLGQSDLTLGTTPGGRAGTTYERARRPVHDRRRSPPSTCWPQSTELRDRTTLRCQLEGAPNGMAVLIGERMACGESPRFSVTHCGVAAARGRHGWCWL